MPDPRTAPLERKYRVTAHLYDILDWPWERLYRRWRPSIVGDVSGDVIEVGVGTGRNLRFYPPQARVHGVDLSEPMLVRARRRAARSHGEVTLEKADALDLSHVAAEDFDWYVATFLFCVLPDDLQPAALREMARVLRPGGRFRLLEILYSDHFLRRLPQKILAPYARLIFGAGFDRRTREHVEADPDLEVTELRWLKGDTHLLIEGRRVPDSPARPGREKPSAPPE